MGNEVFAVQIAHGDVYCVDTNSLQAVLCNPAIFERWVLRISKYSKDCRTVKFIDVNRINEPETGETVAYGGVYSDGYTFLISKISIE